MKKFTVIIQDSITSQIVCYHVEAKGSLKAFALAEAMFSDFEILVALPGWLQESDDMSSPGDSLVNTATVLGQPEVFVKPAYVLTATAIEAVLEKHSFGVADKPGNCFDKLAAELLSELDHCEVIDDAMKIDANTQTYNDQAKREEIKSSLLAKGVFGL
ncbi:hypothetical protein [Pseudomonas sp. LS-2]|uniref:hypothetical protein n=1 Tax=Pseudomonas sp. LS-2 TaxID=2315859 RepID=UPI000E73798F|nr:hypothetical protein [Pseudomonas sp. LS-2]RJX80312.1 hypothetical protein D3M70_12240 [Pseudomonas sp. LS-2]